MTEAILDRAEAVVAGTTPMGRIGQPGELAPTVLFWRRRGQVILPGRLWRLMEGGLHNKWQRFNIHQLEAEVRGANS